MRDSRYFEHAVDVLGFADNALTSGQPTALIVVTAIVGGGVRNVGSLVAVTLDGQMSGYVSNGCVDADVIVQAQQSLQEGKSRTLLYGQGSPFFDIILPCGGTIELLVFPIFDALPLSKAVQTLRRRQEITLSFDTIQNHLTYQDLHAHDGWRDRLFLVRCKPKPRIRVAGQGASFMAVAQLGIETGFEIIAQSSNSDELERLELAGAVTCDHLSSPQSAPACTDDQWTAVLFLFHDHEWETALLLEALKKDAFYIGALGSTKTHAARLQTLTNAGTNPHELSRIIGPVGLVPALRDARQIALSALAQVVDCYVNYRQMAGLPVEPKTPQRTGERIGVSTHPENDTKASKSCPQRRSP